MKGDIPVEVAQAVCDVVAHWTEQDERILTLAQVQALIGPLLRAINKPAPPALTGEPR